MLRLAVVLHKSIEQVEAMPSAHISEWMAYSRIVPFPDPHWDAAMIAQTIASVFGGKGSRPKIDDFLPKPVRPHKAQTPNELAKSLIARFGARRRGEETQ